MPRKLRRQLAAVFFTALPAAIGSACGSQPSSPTTSTTTTISAGGPTVGLSPTSLTFTSPTSDPQTVTLTDTGTDVLVITSVVVSGNFVETDNCVRSLDVGASCTITVSFVPMAPGATGTLTITDNASGSPQNVPLSGPNLTTPSASLSPTNLTFASQSIGTTSAPQTVTLSNPINGLSAPLAISSMVAVGDFAITQNTCGRLLSAGASCAIRITFTPTEPGSRTGLLAIFDNAANGQQAVPLNGTGQ